MILDLFYGFLAPNVYLPARSDCGDVAVGDACIFYQRAARTIERHPTYCNISSTDGTMKGIRVFEGMQEQL